ncbi:sphinganine kinase lcb4 [Aspergillus alliaceus]|uniref:Sphinganine kinase lcb4 n=1 Tax=Petromyces alliaceus TaxID=209559 RepID=A0A5N6GEJ7_PETAA|nr:ATP-NAD kinase-like domain-containing protein [Aspergillus alliaceus]KAB8238933.1 ATP-NAD kinase-like domain-containing protein [Aspergillus alliaceus]KAF5864494.1 sphinganine kinase lcb4 [Aspergillus burnettii]
MTSSNGPSFNHADQPDSQHRLLQRDSTLTVAQSVSLTIGADSLLVADERPKSKDQRACCGLLTKSTKSTHPIRLYNILDAGLSPAGLTITYAKPVAKDSISVTALNYPIAETEKAATQAWISQLLDVAYGEAQRYKRLKVLINPFGGKGAASRQYHNHAAPVFTAARCIVDVQETTHRGHATEIAEQIDIDAYDAIVCCSGDGLPYEVFNGLAKRSNAGEALTKLAVAMIPGGSGNAMAWNLCGTGDASVAALTIIKGLRTPMDLVSLTQGNTRTLSFLSQAFGVIAESDLGTDNIRWMGAHRFTYGFLTRIMQRTVYPCDLAIKVEIDDKRAIKEHYNTYAHNPAPHRSPEEAVEQSKGLPELKYGTVLDDLPKDWEVIPGEEMGNFYAGNMAIVSKDTSFFPASVPNDGLMDIVTINGTIARTTTLKMMTAIPDNEFFDMPDVKIRKATAYRLIPHQKEGYISVDGESIPFEAFQAEIHKGLGTVLSKSGHLYEAEGPRP